MSCSVALDVRCTLGESPTWHAATGTLYFIDIKQGEVHAYQPASGDHRIVFKNDGDIGALCPVARAPHELLLCRTDDIVRVDVEHGCILSKVTNVPPAQCNPAMRFNDGKASPQGVLVTGYMHADWRNGHAGHLYALQAGKLHQVLANVALPNGMVWHNTSMYFVDSGAGTITEYQCDPSSGVPNSNTGRQVACIPKEEGVPDGLDIDSEGRLWVALGEAGAVACYDPDTGAQVSKVPLLCSRPTACKFGDTDLGTLYVTTREEAGHTNASPHHGALLAVRIPGVRGAAAAAEVETLSL